VNFTSIRERLWIATLRPATRGTRHQTPTLIGCCLLKSICPLPRQPPTGVGKEGGV
jgi:hypothetical protein